MSGSSTRAQYPFSSLISWTWCWWMCPKWSFWYIFQWSSHPAQENLLPIADSISMANHLFDVFKKSSQSFVFQAHIISQWINVNWESVQAFICSGQVWSVQESHSRVKWSWAGCTLTFESHDITKCWVQTQKMSTPQVDATLAVCKTRFQDRHNISTICSHMLCAKVMSQKVMKLHTKSNPQSTLKTPCQ